jgi:DNA-binding SARP family transcriptional activator
LHVIFRILGPLEAVDGGRAVELPRRKHRALLATLILHAGEVVSPDRLIEDLWGESPPRTARDALQNYVSLLRKTLGADVLVTREGGYVLEVTPEQVDLGRFERLWTEARATADVGERAAKLREALGLWRGPPLGDLAYEPFATIEVARLEELRLAAMQDLVDAELELGRAAELIPDLEALISEHPFDERLRGQLMLALYRAGRQSEALEAYQTARRTLDEELGLEPGPLLRELEQAILRHDPSLDSSAPTPASRRTATIVFVAADAQDPEAVGGWLRKVRDAMSRHGGRTAFAADAAMGVFGAPQAHEDDALRAVRAAVELRSALPAARIGIATGPVYVDGDVVAGAPVTLAGQLEQAAPAGETLVSASTLRLVRDAVRVRRATWVSADAFRLDEVVEGAPGVARRFSTPLVDRRHELAALRDAFADARDRRSCAVFTVLGDAGIGKTRLARELAREVRDTATVLVGRCVSYGEGATYLPLTEMIDTDFLDAGSTGEIFLRARRELEARAAERPLLLLFEDVHWAEPTLLDFVEYLAEHATGSPMLALCLARPDLMLERSRWNASLVLEPLTDAQSRELVGEAPDADRIVEIAEGNPLYVQQLAAYVEEEGAAALDSIPASIEAIIASRVDRLGVEERSLAQRAAVVGRRFTLAAAAALGPTDALPRLERDAFVHHARDQYRFHHALVRDVVYAGIPKAERAELHRRHADWLDGQPEGTDELVGYHLEQAADYLRELGAPDQQVERLAANAGARLGAAGIRAWKHGDATTTANLLGRAVDLVPELDPRRLELGCELGEALMTAGEYARSESVLIDVQSKAAASGHRNLELRARLSWMNTRLYVDPATPAGDLVDEAERAAPVLGEYGDDRALGRAWYYVATVRGSYHLRYEDAEQAARIALVHYDRAGWPNGACLSVVAAALYNGPAPVSEALPACEELLAGSAIIAQASMLSCVAALRAMKGDVDQARAEAQEGRALLESLGQTAACEYQYGEVEPEIELAAGDTERARQLLERNIAWLERMGERAFVATRKARLAGVLCDAGRVDEAEHLARQAQRESSPDDLVTQTVARESLAKALARRGSLVEAETLAQEAIELLASADTLRRQADALLALADVLDLAGNETGARQAIAGALELLRRKGDVVGAAHVSSSRRWE